MHTWQIADAFLMNLLTSY